MKTVDARGQQCPIPVVKAKKAMQEMKRGEVLEVLVDNEIAVQNLSKMAADAGAESNAGKTGEKEYKVTITVGQDGENTAAEAAETAAVTGDTVVVIASDRMGNGNDELGGVLIKGFIYALTELEEAPKAVLFYNGGAKLTCEGSDSIADLKTLEAQGTEILTCGTCLNYYGLTEKLQVGSVTNMYVIVEKQAAAGKIIRP